jgi:HK97 family phage prohead protease
MTTVDTGEVIARFSTFDIVDRDGDIVRSSSFRDGQPVRLVWAHDWTAPIGKGVIKVKQDHAEFHGTFFSDDDSQQKRVKVRDAGELQEWSFGFRITHVQPNDTIPGLDITEAEIFEVSPVLVGANPQTATLGVKAEREEEAELRRLELERLALEAIELGLTGYAVRAASYRLSSPVVKVKSASARVT